jgi:hypothetical protein
VTYYPANTSVLHAVGLMTMGSDWLSLFINLALVPVALLAGWCIGERAGVGPVSLAGVAVALTIPVVVVSEAATAKDDLLGIVGLLACIAFVVHSGRDANRAAAVYSGLAAGLAIGSKLTLVAPVLALAVCLAVVTPSGARISTMTRWAVAAFATGGYWYLRNLLAVGNPLPGLGVGVGDVHLPRPPTPSMDDFGTNLLHNLANGRVWHESLLPGLRTGFGGAWPVIMLIAAGAIMFGIVKMRGRDLVAPAVGVVAFGAFVVTPGTVWAPQLIGRPGVRFVTANLFAFNLRYMLPAVAIGLVILPLVAGRWRHGPLVATAALGIALAATQVAPQSRQAWSIHQVPVALAIGAIAAVVMVRLTSGRALLPAVAPTPVRGVRGRGRRHRDRMAACAHVRPPPLRPARLGALGRRAGRRTHWIFGLCLFVSALRKPAAEPRANDRSARARRCMAPGAHVRGVARGAPPIRRAIRRGPRRASRGRARHRSLALASGPARR